MVSKSDYGKREVEAARSVLMELAHILGEFRESSVVVGGNVISLLYPELTEIYVGTLDVDIALDHRVIDDDTYHTIKEQLISRGYVEGKQPFIFTRVVEVEGGRPVKVEVDFLAGEYEGASLGHRTQRVQDIRARKARGCDLAFQSNEIVEIEGRLPDGSKDIVQVRVAGIIPFIVMKGMAIEGRIKEKDSWDVYFCLRYHPEGIDSIIEEFRLFIRNGLVREGLEHISKKFASPDHIGPRQVTDFEEISDAEERERIQRDAFERVDYLLRSLEVR